MGGVNNEGLFGGCDHENGDYLGHCQKRMKQEKKSRKK